MSKIVNILFLGGAKRVSLAERFISAGKRLGIEVHLFSYELDKYVPIASVAEVIIGLKWRDPALLGHLDQIVKEKNIHIALPCVDPAISILSTLVEMHEGLFAPISDTEINKTFFDKRDADVWFKANHFPVPEDNGTYPKIAKPITGSASKGIVVLDNPQAMEGFLEKNNVEDFIIQRFIKGEEYTIDCYTSQKGVILGAVPRLRMEISGGEVVKAKTVRDDKMIELARRIITAAGFKGPVNVQVLKENGTGELSVMEINPRFGGGVILSMEAGVDMAEMILREYAGLEVKPIDNWQDELLMSRANREFFSICN